MLARASARCNALLGRHTLVTTARRTGAARCGALGAAPASARGFSFASAHAHGAEPRAAPKFNPRGRHPRHLVATAARAHGAVLTNAAHTTRGLWVSAVGMPRQQQLQQQQHAEPQEGAGATDEAEADARETGLLAGPAPPDEAADVTRVIDFWFRGTQSIWWTKNPDFDAEILDTFEDLMQQAQRGELDGWTKTPRGAVALVVVLDQFSRNCYRGDSRSFDFDPLSREVTLSAVKAGVDLELPVMQATMLLMPLMHSEELAHHALLEERYALIGAGTANVDALREHSEILRRFGRYPHRNAVYPDRVTTPEEQVWLDAGGGF